MKAYEKMSREELLDVIFILTGNSTKIRAYNAFKKQVEGIVKYLDENILATKNNLSDKDEKSFDRGKTLLSNLASYTKELDELEKVVLSLGQGYIKKAEEGTLESYLLNQER